MTIVGIDDTDSRDEGMCTTYLGAVLADRFESRGASVSRRLLVRLNPGVEYKTRGNAAVAVHTDIDPSVAAETASALVDRYAVTEDSRTAPGVVVAPDSPADVDAAVARFTHSAITEHVAIDAARSLATDAGYRLDEWGDGRGIIGALAAVGAWAGRSDDDWTGEYIAYRHPERRGTPRGVDSASVFRAADAEYPVAWDTVDRTAEELVCVPRTPGPILYGIRGDTEATVNEVGSAIDSEPIERDAVFLTNQGTDDHLQPVSIDGIVDGAAYRTTGTVETDPETREGGHVFFELGDGEATIECVAFEPTKRFRGNVRALRCGDRITVCGEVSAGTLKLEKFAVRSLTESRLETPTCPSCQRRMESAGADQGYRCRDCATTAPQKVAVGIDRELEVGWYEVPPRARRHIAKPLVRGGFDAPIHPER